MALSFESSYEIKAVHVNGYYTGTVDDYTNLDYTLATNEMGVMTLDLPGSYPIWTFTVDTRIEIWRSVGTGQPRLEGDTQWFIQTISRITDDAGNRSYRITAFDAKCLLMRRIVAYNKGDLVYSESLGAYAGNICNLIVRQNLGSSAVVAARSIASYLTIASDTNNGAFFAIEYSHQVVFDAVKKICDTSYQNGVPLYFDVTVANPPNSFMFQTYTTCRGIDRRASTGNNLIIGYDQGTMGAFEITDDYSDEVTFVYAGGPGTNDIQGLQTVEDVTRSGRSLFGRREGWFDFQNADTDPLLLSEAQGALASNRPHKTLVGKILNTEGALYGVHWNFGDYVTASADDEQFSCIISAVHVTVSGNGAESIDAALRSD